MGVGWAERDVKALALQTRQNIVGRKKVQRTAGLLTVEQVNAGHCP